MPDVGANPDPHVGRDGVTLRQDVLEVYVPCDIAPRDPPEADRIVARGVDDHALETLLEARARR